MSTDRHWQQVYAAKESTTVSWFEAEPVRSLGWIREAAPDPGAAILDVGAGASLLVDRLLDHGYRRLAVLDIAPAALDEVRARLGDRAVRVEYFAGDVLDFVPPHPFDLWHDRAVLHFLRTPEEQRRYAGAIRRTLRPGGHAMISTFARGGPTRCSGLEVVQYDAAALATLLGGEFTLVREEIAKHRTPAGAEQLFQHCLFVRAGAA
jgi:2-polyprenyl-3-methyl-5-hydroxy-6-metoxy-1,4-benzoquinol methylase